MKWTKASIAIVVVLLSASYIYSSISSRELSDKVKSQKMKACLENKPYDCGLIERYHSECFNQSYRSYLKTKEFHPSEYDSCLKAKIEKTGDS